LRHEHVGVGFRAGPAAGVERAKLFRLRVVDEREDIAPNPGHRRLDDGEDGGGCDRRINRVAALLHDLQARGRGEWLARRDHAVAREHGRARAAGIARGAIAGQLRGHKGHSGDRQERDRGRQAHVILRGAGEPGVRAGC
jgi:hypothetical protein